MRNRRPSSSERGVDSTRGGHEDGVIPGRSMPDDATEARRKGAQASSAGYSWAAVAGGEKG